MSHSNVAEYLPFVIRCMRRHMEGACTFGHTFDLTNAGRRHVPEVRARVQSLPGEWLGRNSLPNAATTPLRAPRMNLAYHPRNEPCVSENQLRQEQSFGFLHTLRADQKQSD